MKKILILALFISASLSGQKPEKIYPNAREQKSLPYLRQQSVLWQKEVQKDPKNAEAWYNYYYANRNLGFNDTTRTPQEKDAVTKKIVDDMGAAIPETYEYNLVRWQSGG